MRSLDRSGEAGHAPRRRRRVHHGRSQLRDSINRRLDRAGRWIDAYLAIEDERAREAMRLLAASGVVAGESGAASTGGLLELMKGVETRRVREALKVGPEARSC